MASTRTPREAHTRRCAYARRYRELYLFPVLVRISARVRVYVRAQTDTRVRTSPRTTRTEHSRVRGLIRTACPTLCDLQRREGMRVHGASHRTLALPNGEYTHDTLSLHAHTHTLTGTWLLGLRARYVTTHNLLVASTHNCASKDQDNDVQLLDELPGLKVIPPP
jgi:hypothetical protein